MSKSRKTKIDIDFPEGNVVFKTEQEAIAAAQVYMSDHPRSSMIMIYKNDKNHIVVTPSGVSRPDGF